MALQAVGGGGPWRTPLLLLLSTTLEQLHLTTILTEMVGYVAYTHCQCEA